MIVTSKVGLGVAGRSEEDEAFQSCWHALVLLLLLWIAVVAVGLIARRAIQFSEPDPEWANVWDYATSSRRRMLLLKHVNTLQGPQRVFGYTTYLLHTAHLLGCRLLKRRKKLRIQWLEQPHRLTWLPGGASKPGLLPTPRRGLVWP